MGPNHHQIGKSRNSGEVEPPERAGQRDAVGGDIGQRQCGWIREQGTHSPLLAKVPVERGQGRRYPSNRVVRRLSDVESPRGADRPVTAQTIDHDDRLPPGRFVQEASEEVGNTVHQQIAVDPGHGRCCPDTGGDDEVDALVDCQGAGEIEGILGCRGEHHQPPGVPDPFPDQWWKGGVTRRSGCHVPRISTSTSSSDGGSR